jgi:hypothetical protein
LKKSAVIFLLASTLLFAENFNTEEIKISNNLTEKIHEKESGFFSITPLSSKKKRYFICKCENFEIPYEKGLGVLLDYSDYENRFRYIAKSQNKGGGYYFFVLGVPLVKSRLWGEIEENLGENRAKISFTQTKKDVNYPDSAKSMITIDFDKFVLQWDLLKIDEKKSRFCLTGAAQPEKDVPQWLIKTAIKKIIPRTLKNINDK